MLRLSLQSLEIFNEEKQEFETIGGLNVELEHSLYTVAKWEAVHKKFFVDSQMDFDFLMSYIKEMCLTEDVPENAWLCMTQPQLSQVLEYIQDSHTATKITQRKTPKASSQKISSELIYYWMFSLQIPIECEHWHFNRLMTLISVASIESAPKQKMSKKSAMQQQRELNAMRRAKYNTKG